MNYDWLFSRVLLIKESKYEMSVCSIQLQSVEREGFEYDYCQKCRGVWLDRGTLDSLIEDVETERVRTSLQMTGQRTVSNGGNYCALRKVQQRSFLGNLFYVI